MLMTIDVGNTNIAVGVFKDEELVTTFRMMTSAQRTSDELGAGFRSIFMAKDLNKDDVTEVVISSVVPDLNHSLINMVKKYFEVDPLMISTSLKTGIITDIKDLGNDRLVDMAAAYKYYGPEVLVIDFGTATTYDYVNKDGTFLTGITAPGIKIEADALTNMAAQLPKVELVYPDSVLTVDTVSSMQVGIVYGYLGSVEYIIRKIKEEVNPDCKVVATGGYGSLICPNTDMIDYYDKDLAYKGMKLILEMNK